MMTYQGRAILRLALALSALIALVGGAALSSAQVTAPQDRNERAELRFLEGMIDHHQMALDMAADCLEKATTESVIALCEAIIEAQSAEIAQMQIWLLDWYGVTYAPMSMDAMMVDMSDGGGHAGHGGRDEIITDPPMMMGMMAGLSRLEGVEYEVAWLEAMIDHHDDALHMAERILPRVVHDDLGTLAEAIIDAQSAEITLMESLIAELTEG